VKLNQHSHHGYCHHLSVLVGHQPDRVDSGILPLLPRARRLCGAQPDEGISGEGEGFPKKDRATSKWGWNWAYSMLTIRNWDVKYLYIYNISYLKVSMKSMFLIWNRISLESRYPVGPDYYPSRFRLGQIPQRVEDDPQQLRSITSSMRFPKWPWIFGREFSTHLAKGPDFRQWLDLGVAVYFSETSKHISQLYKL